ncbi:MAG: hypothetical protein IVW55_16570 [Chloroflexi bacterium]|nr:hypothetical protein [Chloroflexota bacterium]
MPACDNLDVLAAPPEDVTERDFRRSARNETVAIILLPFGSILTFAAWLVIAQGWSTPLQEILAVVTTASGWMIGVVLLWTSPQWRIQDKLVGTLLLPGGFLLALWLFVKQFAVFTSAGYGCTSGVSPPVPTHCTALAGQSHTYGSSLTLALLAVAVLVPTVTAIHLNRRRRVPAH